MMSILLRITVLLLTIRSATTLGSALAQEQKGFVSVSNSSRIKVLLECGSQVMSVKLVFADIKLKEFKEWIVVGSTNRAECRQKGSGDLQYLIEIPILVDPCGTKMVGGGTFENTISIKKHPFLILEGDELVTVRCVYGPPEIGTLIIPSFPLSQAAQPYTTSLPSIQSASVQPVVAVSTIYLIVFLILFLALLFLFCGCMAFFCKRRKLRVERRKKILLAVPQGSELSKLGLQKLWWTGKKTSNSNLLSHDYMVSSNSTREHLSISTEYASDTPSTSGGAGSPDDAFQPQQLYVHESKHMIPKPHMDTVVRAPGVMRSLQCIPEERNETACKISEPVKQPMGEASKGKHESEVLNLNMAAVYGQVDTSRKQNAHPQPSTSKYEIDFDPANFGPSGRELQSVTGMYSYPDEKVIAEDAESMSTLEGRQYYPLVVSEEKAPTTMAEIHLPIAAPPLPPSPPPRMSPPLQNPPPIPPKTKSKLSQPEQVAMLNSDLEIYIKVIEQHRGPGPKHLSELEVGKWRDLVRNHKQIQTTLTKAKTLEDFEAISHQATFEGLFSREKWALIVQSLAHVAFLKHLNDIIDNQSQTAAVGPSKVGRASMNKKIDMVASAADKFNMQQDSSQEQRLFTRESYCEIKNEVELAVSSGSDETLHGPRPSDHQRNVAKFDIDLDPDDVDNAVKLRSHDQFRERSSSEILENAPTLSVYLGNVPSRGSGSVPKNNNGDSFNYYMPSMNSESASIYGTTA